MGVYIKGMELPENCALCPVWDAGNCLVATEAIICEYTKRPSDCPLVPVQPHGRLIDADALRQSMYHEAFETDSPMQKWGSGCWIRYKMFERLEENAPTIIPAEEGE